MLCFQEACVAGERTIWKVQNRLQGLAVGLGVAEWLLWVQGFLSGWWKCPQVDGGDGCAAQNIVKTIGLYTLNVWIVLKLLFKKKALTQYLHSVDANCYLSKPVFQSLFVAFHQCFSFRILFKESHGVCVVFVLQSTERVYRINWSWPLNPASCSWDEYHLVMLHSPCCWIEFAGVVLRTFPVHLRFLGLVL